MIETKSTLGNESEFKKPQRTLWLDLEFTGLSLQKDLLLEIGAVVTDGLFKEIDAYQSFVSHDSRQVAALMAQDDWWPSRPMHRANMLDEISRSSKTVGMVDKELVEFARPYFDGPIVPAGSSPNTDRQFIARDLPFFHNQLHYRTIDVSSFKEVARRCGIKEYEKSEQHRVLADIRESIHELEYVMKKIGSSAVQRYIQG